MHSMNDCRCTYAYHFLTIVLLTELLSLLGKKAGEVLEDFEEDGLKALYARAEGEDLEPTTSSREHTPVSRGEECVVCVCVCVCVCLCMHLHQVSIKTVGEPSLNSIP